MPAVRSPVAADESAGRFAGHVTAAAGAAPAARGAGLGGIAGLAVRVGPACRGTSSPRAPVPSSAFRDLERRDLPPGDRRERVRPVSPRSSSASAASPALAPRSSRGSVPVTPGGMDRSVNRCSEVEYVSAGSGWPRPSASLISFQRCMSRQSTNVTATPVRPARPVRPIRCT